MRNSLLPNAGNQVIKTLPARFAPFEATGCRGGFMISHPRSTPRDMQNVVDFLIPELQRRGRFRTAYEGSTLMENLAA